MDHVSMGCKRHMFDPLCTASVLSAIPHEIPSFCVGEDLILQTSLTSQRLFDTR